MASSFSAPWPDPNSPVLAKIDFGGVPVAEVIKWLDVRDTFLGDNYRNQDIRKALILARDCKHPDAVWLTSIFEGEDVSTYEEAREVLLRQNDPRALYFAWWLLPDDTAVANVTPLQQAAEIGYGFACSTLFGHVSHFEAFSLAERAVAGYERDGFYCKGDCFYYGDGCEKNLELAKENYLVAAELGHGPAAGQYGFVLEDESNNDGWVWLIRAALHGSPGSFLACFSEQVEKFFSGCGNASLVFMIGQTLKGNIDMDKKQIFRRVYKFDRLIDPANRAISFYESQIKSARLALDTWTLIGKRFGVVKDIRRLIANMIWDGRGEANYTHESMQI